MNYALLIWIVLLALIAVMTYLAVMAILQLINGNNVYTIPTTNQCSITFTTENDYTNTTCCYSNATTPTSLRFIPDAFNSQPTVVGSIPVYFQQACIQYCTNGFDSTTNTCVNSTTNTSTYNACIALIQPVKCTGPAIPTGHVASQLSYVQGNASNCTITGPCVSV
jgi:hypothetical protein